MVTRYNYFSAKLLIDDFVYGFLIETVVMATESPHQVLNIKI